MSKQHCRMLHCQVERFFRQSRMLLWHRCRFWQQCRTKFRPFDEVETNWTCSISFGFVERTKLSSTLLPKAATLLTKNDNNVEAIFDFVERTKFCDKLVRHCCRFWQQSRTLLRQSRTLLWHCCWCGRGFKIDRLFVNTASWRFAGDRACIVLTKYRRCRHSFGGCAQIGWSQLRFHRYG